MPPSLPGLSQESLERLNRAQRFFGDPIKRLNDRLRLEGNSVIEQYRRGNLALILDCDSNVIGFPKSDGARFVHEPSSVFVKGRTLLIFKADVRDLHKLQDWDKKLVFIDNIQIIQGPETGIPSLIGLYCFQDQIRNQDRNLLLFKSGLNGGHKLLPGIADWETCIFSGLSAAVQNNFIPQQVKTTSKIVENIADSDRKFVSGEPRHVDVEAKMICPLPFVVLNANGVKIIGGREPGHQSIHVHDVFLGPFNL
jgi:hypothetical protein